MGANLNPIQVLYDLTKFSSSRLSLIPNYFVYDVSDGQQSASEHTAAMKAFLQQWFIDWTQIDTFGD